MQKSQKPGIGRLLLILAVSIIGIAKITFILSRDPEGEETRE